MLNYYFLAEFIYEILDYLNSPDGNGILWPWGSGAQIQWTAGLKLF